MTDTFTASRADVQRLSQCCADEFFSRASKYRTKAVLESDITDWVLRFLLDLNKKEPDRG